MKSHTKLTCQVQRPCCAPYNNRDCILIIGLEVITRYCKSNKYVLIFPDVAGSDNKEILVSNRSLLQRIEYIYKIIIER